ncbi:ribosome small subunit-dependent GTPase A [Thiobacter aerophilum]|uniref:Small ribosomal subunit biogenesis GTPase RsgA n=1 Tax=Thiobacter aerophilum TaxID=3121275 RepID=A0ABV0EEQ1_9BURK
MAQGLLPGRVVAAHGKRYQVELADGRILGCVTRGKKTGVACGDRVQVRPTGSAQGVIESVGPRESLLYRSDPYRQKVLAANVTQVIVVVAAVPSFYEELVNRALVAAEAAHLRSVIVLNKADLSETAQAQARLALYHQLGYPLVKLSATRDVSPLHPHLARQVSVLVGQSGMGKSTLVNALVPGAHAATREISQALDSGRHTTTHATLYHLDGESDLIDSPGLQEFGLYHLSPEEVAQAFVEFRPYLGRCRFHNCRHLVEPGCAILEAAENGTLSPRRLTAYQAIVREHLDWQARRYA